MEHSKLFERFQQLTKIIIIWGFVGCNAFVACGIFLQQPRGANDAQFLNSSKTNCILLVDRWNRGNFVLGLRTVHSCFHQWTVSLDFFGGSFSIFLLEVVILWHPPWNEQLAAENWWLEDYFPVGMAYFQGLCSCTCITGGRADFYDIWILLNGFFVHLPSIPFYSRNSASMIKGEQSGYSPPITIGDIQVRIPLHIIIRQLELNAFWWHVLY